MEILVYIGVVAIIILVVSSFLLWVVRSNAKARAMGEVVDNVRRAMETMTYEIREASSIYLPTSVFDSHPGQLSLEVSKYLPDGENLTYIDFYLCGAKLCLKKELENPIPLTSDRVIITNLVFSQVATTSTTPSIQINLKIDYKTVAGRKEYQASFNTTSTVSLRSY